jgi:hypothetical protein
LTPGGAQKDTFLDGIAYFIARVLIRQITQSIVDWINSGFNGNPSFVQDPEQFARDSVDRVIGEFIFASDLKFLCSPFEINVRLNLGMQYSPFKDKINCTLSQILQNVDGAVTQAYTDFMNGDFINGGGWDSWLNITTVPQNNQLGAMIITQGELDARIADRKILDGNELNWSGGLLSMKQCTRTTYDASGNETGSESYRGDPVLFTGKVGAVSTSSRAMNVNFNDGSTVYAGSTKDVCKVVTPGTWITGTGNKVLGWDLDRLGVADEINEIVGALANFAISKVMQKGMAMIKKDDLSANDPSWQAGIAALQSQQNNAINAAGSNSNYQPSYSTYVSPINPSDPLAGMSTASAVASAQTTIQTQKTLEQTYQNTVSNVLNLLFVSTSSAYNAFSAQQACEPLVKTEVMDRIDGTKAYDPTDLNRLAFSESLNKVALEQKIAASVTNVANLDSLSTALNTTTADNATISAALSQAVTNNPNMHRSADIAALSSGGSQYIQIQAWLTVMRDNYKGVNDACKANLSVWGI